MIILGNILLGLANVLHVLLTLMVYLVIGRAIISWVNADPSNGIVRFLHQSTEPLLQPLRRFIPPLGGSIDLTPIVLLLVIYFLQTALVGILQSYARSLLVGA